MHTKVWWYQYASSIYFSDAVRKGGDTKITPSPRTKSISIVLFEVCNNYIVYCNYNNKFPRIVVLRKKRELRAARIDLRIHDIEVYHLPVLFLHQFPHQFPLLSLIPQHLPILNSNAGQKHVAFHEVLCHLCIWQICSHQSRVWSDLKGYQLTYWWSLIPRGDWYISLFNKALHSNGLKQQSRRDLSAKKH